MRSIVVICLFGAFLAQAYAWPRPRSLGVDPDCARNVSQLISSNGYPVEEYSVVTEDGYILGLQRIPGPKGSKPTPGAKSTTGKVAFLQHGLFSSAADFVINLPSQSLGFIMADAGYDVWLGNVRGNTYSRKHKTLDPSKIEFWDFTFDEFIQYDIPAMIDTALNISGQESLYYVGHSQGTIVMFGLLAERPEFASKIRAFAAMGPVANVTDATSPIRYIAPFSNDLDWILEHLGEGEILPSSTFMKVIAEVLCKPFYSEFICEDTLFLLLGLDSQQLNTTRLPVYACHSPAGTSIRNVAHYGQEINSQRFWKYNFGTDKNMKKYGQATPPEYDVTKVTAPVALFWSQNDWLADPVDVDIGLRKRLPNLKLDFMVSEKEFTHIDFLFGIRANELVYVSLLDFFTKY